jgi:hypothetical protein
MPQGTGAPFEDLRTSGIAVATAYATAPNSAESQAAATALDKNSVAVADAVGTIAPEQRDIFLDAWRAHIGDFVSYAVAAKGRDDEATAKEAADLAAYTQSQGAFFEQMTFLEQWRSHISDFVDYALAAAAADEAGKQQQLDDLNAYRASAGEFFSDITGGVLAAADVTEALGHHAETLAGAIDSFSGALVDR